MHADEPLAVLRQADRLGDADRAGSLDLVAELFQRLDDRRIERLLDGEPVGPPLVVDARGAQGVGQACTESFVAGFVVILILDFFIALALKGAYEYIWGFKTVF